VFTSSCTLHCDLIGNFVFVYPCTNVHGHTKTKFPIKSQCNVQEEVNT